MSSVQNGGTFWETMLILREIQVGEVEQFPYSPRDWNIYLLIYNKIKPHVGKVITVPCSFWD